MKDEQCVRFLQWANGERYVVAGEDADMTELVAEIARLLDVKAPKKAPAWVLKIYARISMMVAAVTGKEPDVTPEIVTISKQTGVTFHSDKAIRELGYRILSHSHRLQEFLEQDLSWVKRVLGFPYFLRHCLLLYR